MTLFSNTDGFGGGFNLFKHDISRKVESFPV